jgi:hypothetical protein
MLVMGKFTDFDLDLNVEKDTNTSKNNRGTSLPNTWWDCVTLSLAYCTKWPGCTGASCACSPSDMTACDACYGARNEDDGNGMQRC